MVQTTDVPILSRQDLQRVLNAVEWVERARLSAEAPAQQYNSAMMPRLVQLEDDLAPDAAIAVNEYSQSQTGISPSRRPSGPRAINVSGQTMPANTFAMAHKSRSIYDWVLHPLAIGSGHLVTLGSAMPTGTGGTATIWQQSATGVAPGIGSQSLVVWNATGFQLEPNILLGAYRFAGCVDAMLFPFEIELCVPPSNPTMPQGP